MQPNYDVFISHKSEDQQLAVDLSEFLRSQGLRVFNSSQTLAEIANSNYRQAIDQAIDHSAHMIVVASSLVNIESDWVAFEWGAFANDIRSGKEANLLTICNFDIQRSELPIGLRVHELFHYTPGDFERLMPYCLSHLKDETHTVKKLPLKFGVFYSKRPLPYAAGEINRENCVVQIRQLLEEHNPVVIISGLGGLGKTTVLKQYVEQNKNEYASLFWLEFVNDLHSTFLNQIDADKLQFTRKDDTTDEKNFQTLVQKIAKLSGPKLIAIDNMNQLKDIQMLYGISFPETMILLTSRSNPPIFKTYDLLPLNLQQSEQLFYRYYTKERDDLSLHKLLELVHRHTLTIELMAKTAEVSLKMTIQNLYERFKSSRFTSTEFKKINIPILYGKNAYESQMYTFMLELFNLSELSPEECDVLSNFAILPSVDFSLIEITYLFSIEDEESDELLDFSNLLNGLIKKGWLMKEQDNVRLHPVIKEVIREKLTITIAQTQQIIGAVNEKLKVVKLQVSIQDYKLLKNTPTLKFVDLAISIAEFFGVASDERLADLLFHLSFILQKQLRHDKALRYQLQSIEIVQHLATPNKRILANSYDNLAWIYRELALYDEGITAGLNAISVKMDPEIFSQVDSAFTYHRIASIYSQKGLLEPAFEYQKKAVEIREQSLGQDDLATLNSYHDLAALYTIIGLVEPARTFLKKAIEKRLLRIPISIDTANSYSIYSTIAYLSGNYNEALEHQKRAQEIYIIVLYENHWRIGHSFSKQALVELELGDLLAANACQQEALKIKEIVFGTDHPSTAFTYNVSSLIAAKEGDFEKALDLQERILAIRTKTQVRESIDIGHCHFNRSKILAQAGQTVLAREAVTLAKKIYLVNHLNVDSVFMKNLTDLERQLD